MKIVHLVGGNFKDGASTGAINLHLALVRKGISSRLIVAFGDKTSDQTITILYKNKLSILIVKLINKIFKLPLLFYKNKDKIFFNLGFNGVIKSNSKLIADADIIHLHWINGLINLKSISNLKVLTIWTIRDMWPFTGGCHYSMGCEKYQNGCGNCPQLDSINPNDITHYIYNKKREYFNKIVTVSISNWIYEGVSSSRIFKNNKNFYIANCIDCNSFQIIDKKFAREKIKLNFNKKIILIGSINNSDIYKGLGYFLKNINKINHDFKLIFFGNFDKKIIENYKIDYLSLGYIDDIKYLNYLYAAADVFISTSLYEAFGKTVVESLASGTPVVCFDNSGPASIVQHLHNGYISNFNNYDDLTNGVNFILSLSKADYKEYSLNARIRALNFDSEYIAEQYIKIYKELL